MPSPEENNCWADCEKQVRGFPNAKFKKFLTEHEANNYIETHRVRDGSYSYTVDPSSSLSSPYPGPSQQQNVPLHDPNDLSGFDNMTATALMAAVFGRQSTSTGYLPPFAPTHLQQQQQRNMSTSAAASRAGPSNGSNGNGAAAPPSSRPPQQLQQQQQQPAANAAPTSAPLPVRKRPIKTDTKDLEEYNLCKRARLLQSVSFTDAPVVYTDGACSKNGRHNSKAGWGVWWGEGHADNQFGAVPGEQTNNRAELMAVIKAINTARARGMTRIIVRTDSQLLMNSMDKWIVKWKSNGWRTADGKNVKNQDLLQILDAQLENFPVTFEHVPGHAGVHGNEMADQLARHAASEVAAGRLFFTDL